MGAATVATFEQFREFYHPGSPTYRPGAGKDVVVMLIFRKTESVKNSFTVQERSKRKNNAKSGLQCVSNSFILGQRTWTDTSRGPRLQQSRLQGRKELKAHSWGSSIHHLAPATLLAGNESSFSTCYFKPQN